jgi:transcriptional regulator GlxA family with amidase domain
MTNGKKPIHVSLVAILDAMLSPLSGLYDVLNCFELLGTFDDAVPDENTFQAEIVGPTAAQAIAKFMLLQWHLDGQAPYIVFEIPTDHGDAAVMVAQEWLRDHFTVATPVDEMVRRSGLAERSFKRRFTKATGCSPITYVQHLRVEEAKRRLERTDAPIDEISWNVGYEDPAFFRRLFKRITRITPGAYRRKLRLPDFAATGSLDQIAP